MARGTRRADIKNRLNPRQLSWFGWILNRVWSVTKVFVLVAILCGLALWGWGQGYGRVAGGWLHGKMAAATAAAGMRVSDVRVEGRHYIEADVLKAAIGVTPGMPLFAVDIDTVHARLTAIPWVKAVQVRRVLPDRLVISLTERLPAALWVDAPQGAAVVDETGVVLTRSDVDSYGTLLAVSGKGAPEESGALIALLKVQPDIAVRVKKAARVSERRWDLYLESGLILRLPEDDPGFALARASKAQMQEKILDLDLRAVDLRQSDRIILESKMIDGKPSKTRDLLLKGGNPV